MKIGILWRKAQRFDEVTFCVFAHHRMTQHRLGEHAVVVRVVRLELHELHEK